MNIDDLTSQTIFQQSPISTQIFLPNGQTLIANKAWERLWGVKHEQIKGYNVLKDSQLVKKGIMPYIKQGFKGKTVAIPPIKYEPNKTINVKNAVDFRWVKALLYPVTDDKGKLKFVVLHHEDITDQKKYEEKIQDSEIRFKTLTSFAPVGIFQTDLKGNCVYVNERWCQYAGLTPDQAYGSGWIKALYPEDKDRVFKEWYNAAKYKKEFVSEYRFLDLYGKTTWLSGNAIALKDAAGKTIGFLGTIIDITDKKRRDEERALQANILKNITNSVITTDLQGQITYWNKGAEKMFGYSKDEMLGKTPAALYTNIDEASFKKDIRKVLKGKPYEGEWQGRKKNGKLIWIQAKTSVLHDAKNKTIGFIGVSNDITQRKVVEEALKASEERLRLALDAGNIGVWDWDIENNEITWTDNIYKIHGIKKGQFDRTFDEYQKLIYKDDKEAVLTSLDNAFKKGKPYEIEFRAIGPNKKIIWIATSGRVLFDEKGKPCRMLGATIDITHRKYLEEQKDEFIALASHELKTPLTSLKVFTQVLEKTHSLKNDSKSKDLLKKMSSQVDKLIALIRDLLDVTRIQEGKIVLRKEKFYLNPLIKDISEEVGRTTSQHKILMKLSKNVKVHSDRDRLGQVLTNLLINAIKYTPSPSNIIVSTKIQNKYAFVFVKDRGVGISKQKQKFIFDRFYRAGSEGNTYTGLGLGLYISKEIIKNQGGEIYVKSTPRKGSTFTFSIPLSNSKR